MRRYLRRRSPIFAALGGFVLLLSILRQFPVLGIANAISPDGLLSQVYRATIMKSQWVFGWCALLASLLLPGLRIIIDAFCQNRTESRKHWAFLAFGALSFIAVLLVQHFVFDSIPHVTDAISHIFQAKIFSSGRFWAPAPPCHRHFFQYNILITQSGRWLAPYPPGHAMLLAAFVRTHALWLFGPLSFAITTVAFVWLVRRFYGYQVSMLGGFLFVLSPLNLLLAGSFMSHVSFMLLSVAGLAIGVRAMDMPASARGRMPAHIAAGVLIGTSALCRPQDFALLCLAAFITFLITARQCWTTLWRSTCLASIGLLIPLCLQLIWNRAVYGNAFVLGYGRTPVESLTPLLVPEFGFDESFTVVDGLKQFIWVMARFNKVLFGWPSSLILIPVAFLRKRLDRRDTICLLASIPVFALFFFYQYYGAEYEARFFSPVVPLLTVLTARGLLRIKEISLNWVRRKQFSSWIQIELKNAWILVLATFTLHALLYYWPVYLWPTYSKQYEQASRLVHKSVNEQGITNAVVLIDTSGENDFRYSSGFMWNDPLLENDIIYARDIPDTNHCLVQAFPGRSFYQFVPAEGWRSGQLVAIGSTELPQDR